MASATEDIHVHIFAPHSVWYYGTWRQLVDEGVIQKAPRPTGKHYAYWTNGDWHFFLERQFAPGDRKAEQACEPSESDWWRLRVQSSDLMAEEEVMRYRFQRTINEQSAEMRALRAKIGGQAADAARDAAFQKFKFKVLPCMEGRCE